MANNSDQKRLVPTAAGPFEEGSVGREFLRLIAREVVRVLKARQQETHADRTRAPGDAP